MINYHRALRTRKIKEEGFIDGGNGVHRVIIVAESVVIHDQGQNIFFVLGSGSSNNPCSDIYRGKFAFSAPEVMAMANYIKENRNHVYGFLDIHSYSQLLMYPWSYSKEVISKDKEELVSNKLW